MRYERWFRIEVYGSSYAVRAWEEPEALAYFKAWWPDQQPDERVILLQSNSDLDFVRGIRRAYP